MSMTLVQKLYFPKKFLKLVKMFKSLNDHEKCKKLPKN